MSAWNALPRLTCRFDSRFVGAAVHGYNHAKNCAYCTSAAIADLKLDESRLPKSDSMVENYDSFEAACHGCSAAVGKCFHGIFLGIG